MITADRHMLARISAALDADPFADPVSVCGVALPRVDARRFERELVGKVYPAARGSQADALPNAGVGHPSELNSSRFHEDGVVHP